MGPAPAPWPSRHRKHVKKLDVLFTLPKETTSPPSVILVTQANMVSVQQCLDASRLLTFSLCTID